MLLLLTSLILLSYQGPHLIYKWNESFDPEWWTSKRCCKCRKSSGATPRTQGKVSSQGFILATTPFVNLLPIAPFCMLCIIKDWIYILGCTTTLFHHTDEDWRFSIKTFSVLFVAMVLTYLTFYWYLCSLDYSVLWLYATMSVPKLVSELHVLTQVCCIEFSFLSLGLYWCFRGWIQKVCRWWRRAHKFKSLCKWWNQRQGICSRTI